MPKMYTASSAPVILRLKCLSGDYEKKYVVQAKALKIQISTEHDSKQTESSDVTESV